MSSASSLRAAHQCFIDFYDEADQARETISKIDPALTTQHDYATLQRSVIALLSLLASGVQDLRLSIEQAIEELEGQ